MAKQTKFKVNQMSKIALELASTVASFSNPSVLKGYYQAAISIDLFNSKEEYDDFYKLLIEYMYAVSKSNMFDTSVNLTPEITSPIIDVFNDMRLKYPKATDVFILEAVYDIRKPEYTKESLAYITSQDVVSRRIIERTRKDGVSYNAMTMITSKNIRDHLGDGIRVTAEEKFVMENFFEMESVRAVFNTFTYDEFCVFANDSRFVPALLYTGYSMFNADETVTPQVVKNIYDDFVEYISGEIKNIDVEKLKLMFFYKIFKSIEQDAHRRKYNITREELESCIGLKGTFDRLLGNVSIKRKEQYLAIPDPYALRLEQVSSITGKVIEKGKEQSHSVTDITKSNGQQQDLSYFRKTVDEFPILVVAEQNLDQDIPIRTKEVIVSKRDLIDQLTDFVKIVKATLLINACQKTDPIPDYLKIKLDDATIQLLRDRVTEQTEALENELPEDALKHKDEIGQTVLIRLLQERIFEINNALVFDTNKLCAALSNGQITVNMIQFGKIRRDLDSSRKKLIEISLNIPELYNALLLSGNINKRDIYDFELPSYTRLVETFFNSNNLDVSEITELFKLGKITIADIENMNLENVHIDDNDIVSIYCKIQEKKNEYEEYIKRKYANADSQGLSDEDILETEEEKKLQAELQDLINTKNVYVTLFNKQNQKPLVMYHRTTDIYNEIVENIMDGDDFEKSLSNMTNMLYEDGLITMAQIRQMDDSLVIEILKSGYARQEDIDRFKQEIVSPDEINRIRENLSQKLNGEELENAIRERIYILTYNKLYDLMDKIAKDKNSSKEEKLSMLYAIFSKNTITEKTHREFFETEILVKIYSKLRNRTKKPIIDPTDQIPIPDDEIEPDAEKIDPKNPSKSYVYQTNVIWEFIKLLDPECKFRILSDGYVLFESEKLNKIFIENVWQAGKDGDFIRRGYGATTLILNLDTFKKNQSDIIKRGRHGYKVDVLGAKKHLPRIQVSEEKTKTVGSIIHEKDLKNTGKKVWFELILDHLGITQDNINTKQTNYTQQDLDEINKFIAMSRHKYEEVTR